MRYVVVDTSTQCKIAHPRTGVDNYATLGSARAALARISKIRDYSHRLVVMDTDTYTAQVPEITVINLLTGAPVIIAADTPLCCDPSSETHWSM